MKTLFFHFYIFLFFTACAAHEHKQHGSLTAKDLEQQEKQGNVKKPGSSFNDTLIVDKKSVLFYHPDSAQLDAIQTFNTPMVFSSMTHELEYQMKNARQVLKTYWPKMTIIETNHSRYIKFVKADKLYTVLDLNTINDISGIILFDLIKDPQRIDMMNIDSELNFYFNAQ